VAPGSPAAVNNSGTAQNAILNFAIPQGVQGPVGPQGVPGSAADAALWSTFPATQDVDVGNHQLDNVTAINAPVGLSVIAPTGNIVLEVQDPIGSVAIQGGALDLCGNDLENLGSLTVAGLGNTVEFGSVLPAHPALASYSVLSSEVNINHINPLTQMTIRGQGDVRVESLNGDLNLIGDDVNIATTGATNVLNITSLSIIQNTAGGAYNISAGGAMAVQAGGLISMLTTGSIQIGSGNVLGATTSIEKLDIDDNVVSKVSGASDLQFQNTALVQNSGDASRKVHVEAVDANTEIFGQGVIIKTTGDPAGPTTGDIQFQVAAATPLVISNATGVATFNTLAPQCAVVPAAPADLTNKAYTDTKLPANADITLTNNLAAPAASAATNGPFIYVPSAAGPPTGTPTAIAGATPLYVDTKGGLAKIFAFVAGVWVAI
jgi:hypothetical protein